MATERDTTLSFAAGGRIVHYWTPIDEPGRIAAPNVRKWVTLCGKDDLTMAWGRTTSGFPRCAKCVEALAKQP